MDSPQQHQLAAPHSSLPTPPAPDPAGRSHWGRLVATVLVSVAAVTPGLMAPALAAPVQQALHLSGTAFGAAVTCFFACTALGSFAARRIVPRLPVRAVLGAVGLLAAAVLAGLALAGHLWQLCLLLALAGLGNAFTQPVAARVIAADIAPGRHSFAGGLFGASLGAGPFLPGLLVTLVAAPYGWRPALWTAAGIALTSLAAAALARRPAADSPSAAASSGAGQAPRTAAVHSPRTTGRVVAAWSVAAALATIGSNVGSAYFIQIGTASGFSAGTAGTLQMLASVLGIAVRLGSGRQADRAPHRIPRTVAAMMLTGTAGLALITAGTPVTFLAGALLAVAGGWGWTGLLLAATMRLLPGESARAGAAMQGGLFAGAAIGPLSFGALSGQFGIPATVGLAAAGPLLGALLLIAGIRALAADARSAAGRPAPADTTACRRDGDRPAGRTGGPADR
ncbi:MFS transporter [Streptomyces sp. GS7]|uniref:MFS transporter n=1 Tax=Streptomyces sp. GS7 TaxID=2692234 RepID=UPI001315FDA0|nr:MFS transporter [Streptomyces sp. GS7]QHC24743.1 MFS transporter [Streptomyces sp. GS7]